jgi:galactose mutarotase-like enzyme
MQSSPPRLFAIVLTVLVAAPAGAETRYELQQSTDQGISYVVLRDKLAGIEARIAPEKGGELCSLRVLFQNRMVETIYRACDYSPTPGWSGRAPLLWPAVARNFASGVKPNSKAVDCSYDYQGRRYDIPIHGFVRDMPWKIVEKRLTPEAAAVVLSVADTLETRRAYPFAFQLEVEYRISRGRLEVNYTVHAGESNCEPMFFSIGNHITFRAPLVEGSNPMAMTFESPSTIEYLKDETTMPTGVEVPRSFAKPVRLSEFPTNSAVSLGGYAGNPWMRLSDPAGLAIRLEHSATFWPPSPVLQFNLWGDPRQGLFCPEPWVGIQNSLNLKQGLIYLAPGKDWEWQLLIEPQENMSVPQGDRRSVKNKPQR